MRKKLNFKKNRNNNFVKYISVSLLIIFISAFFLLFKKDYFIIEKINKGIVSKISEFFICSFYSNDNLSSKSLNSKIRNLKKENNELKKILNLEHSNENYVSSVVVNRIPSFWYNKLEISSKKEFNRNSPVINSNGLIGFISKKSNKVSEVNLLTNVNSNNLIPVAINDSSSGMLSGYDKNKNLFKVTNVITNNDIKKGDSVSYKDYKNNNYSGLYIGEVYKENDSDYGLTKTLWVRPSVDFSDILYVLVVTDK